MGNEDFIDQDELDELISGFDGFKKNKIPIKERMRQIFEQRKGCDLPVITQRFIVTQEQIYELLSGIDKED